MIGIDSRKLMRAAAQRLDASHILLDYGMNLDSMYLAGYGIECSLKALLLESLPESKRRTLLFHGSRWHDFERLIDHLRHAGVPLPEQMARAFRQVRTWDTDLRYEAGNRKSKDALAFWENAKIIWSWVQEKIR